MVAQITFFFPHAQHFLIDLFFGLNSAVKEL